MCETFTVVDFIVLSTGVDGGHRYIETRLIYRGKQRRLTVFFASKLDEAKLEKGKPLKVSGTIQDDGDQFGLLLLEAVLVDN